MIYFLEDDNNIRNFVIYALNNTGMNARGFEDPESFWEGMKKETPDLLLLDIMLRERTGCQYLKSSERTAPRKICPL